MEMILAGLIAYIYRRDIVDLVKNIYALIAAIVEMLPKLPKKAQVKTEREILEETLEKLEEKLSLQKLRAEIQETRELLK